MAESYEVVIESDALGTAELRNALSRALPPGDDITLDVRKRESAFRLEPALLVAVISGGFNLLGVLVSSLLTLAKREAKGHLPERQAIRIEDGSGNVIEIPANLSTEKGLHLLEAARGREVRRIYLVSQP